MSEMTVGKPIDRVDGKLKVTGKAQYAAEFRPDKLAYAVALSSSISKGTIAEIDTSIAEKRPGVLAVLTHKNAQRLKESKPDKKGGSMPAERWLPLQSADIHYDGQYVALVVADSLEYANDAAEHISITYQKQDGQYDILKTTRQATQPKEFMGKPLQLKRGKADESVFKDAVSIDCTYVTPIQNHCAMEPSATTAMWDGNKLTVYDATQGVMGTRKVLAEVFGLPLEDVRTISHFIGGGFGSKGFCWPHPMLAAMAAKVVNRPVQLALHRQQNFTNIGHREKTQQRLRLAAEKTGKLTAIHHTVLTGTSTQTEFVEPCGLVSTMLYSCPNVKMEHNLQTLDVGSPTPMRAPGECPGSYALECAMDELAYELKMDPLELRLINYAPEDPEAEKPWSSKHLKECYEQAAKLFGWEKRKPVPGSMREGDMLVGWGMATCTYPANRSNATARARYSADGVLVVSSATQDIGTGTYTIMSQIAADAFGIPLSKVRFELGDTKLPNAPVSGGSQTAASVGTAVERAAIKLRHKLMEQSINLENSALRGRKIDELAYGEGRIFLKDKNETGELYSDILKRSNSNFIEVESSSLPANEKDKDPEDEHNAELKKLDASNFDKTKYSFHSFGAVFTEVRVDPDLKIVRVSRVSGAYDVGKILNYKTARSQAIGGITFGIGMALMEECVRDPNTGRVLTRNLADYLVPVNADVPEIKLHFTNEPDLKFSSVGARGIGEIGITGISAAIANAVFHATGKRIRELPITSAKLLAKA